jgi:hypothetical protein
VTGIRFGADQLDQHGPALRVVGRQKVRQPRRITAAPGPLEDVPRQEDVLCGHFRITPKGRQALGLRVGPDFGIDEETGEELTRHAADPSDFGVGSELPPDDHDDLGEVCSADGWRWRSVILGLEVER